MHTFIHRMFHTMSQRRNAQFSESQIYYPLGSIVKDKTTPTRGRTSRMFYHLKPDLTDINVYFCMGSDMHHNK